MQCKPARLASVQASKITGKKTVGIQINRQHARCLFFGIVTERTRGFDEVIFLAGPLKGSQNKTVLFVQ
jgi:hypothetical protein